MALIIISALLQSLAMNEVTITRNYSLSTQLQPSNVISHYLRPIMSQPEWYVCYGIPINERRLNLIQIERAGNFRMYLLENK